MIFLPSWQRHYPEIANQLQAWTKRVCAIDGQSVMKLPTKLYKKFFVVHGA